MGFEVVEFPVAGKDMQNQASQWLNVRKEKPDWMIMWGWGAMNSTASQGSCKNQAFHLDHFIGNWWAGADADLGFCWRSWQRLSLAANMAAGIGTDFPALARCLETCSRRWQKPG